MNARLICLLAACALLGGCMSEGSTPPAGNESPVQPTSSPEGAFSPQVLTGFIQACEGAPAAGPLPYTTFAYGQVAASFDLPPQQVLTVNLTWESPSPSRLALHLTGPDDKQHSTALPLDSMGSELSLTIKDPPPGTWIVGVGCEGAGAEIDWAADVTSQ
jgi:hypothetical protein